MTRATVVQCPHCGAKNRVPAAAAGIPRCGKCHQPLPWIAEVTDAGAAPAPVLRSWVEAALAGKP